MELLFKFFAENQPLMLRLIQEHLTLSASGTIVGFAIALPMALVATRLPALGSGLSVFANLAQTIPSLAILGLAIPLLGIGFAPALLALTLRALLPIYLNAYVALREVDPALLEAARGIGMTRGQRLLRIELPLASPGILGGLRTAAVESVGIATLAAFIGGGGLGDLILQGIALRDNTRLLAGAVPAAALAISVEMLLWLLQSQLARAVGVDRQVRS